MDEESSRRRGVNPDYVVRIGYEDIEPGDISVLKETLNLSEVAADAAYSLERYFGPNNWFKEFLALSGGEEFIDLARNLNINQAALSSLKNRLSRFKRFDFIDELGGNDSVTQILSYLDRGMHVILELLVVDQRPSGIDDEIMSQLGTKITCLLDNEKDLDSVLTGVSGNRKLRSVLSRLESKQQALIFGHSVPMPMVIKVRDYGTATSYGDFQIEDTKFNFDEDNEDLFGKKL